MQRRNLLSAIGAVGAVGLAGCNSWFGSDDSTPTDSEESAYTVSVYLEDRELSRDVTITVNNKDGSTLFENSYNLSNSNEADEDDTFPASAEPDTIVVMVDGSRFERDWPGIEHPELPCDNPNNTGVEIWVQQNEKGSAEIRLEVNCQTVLLDG